MGLSGRCAWVCLGLAWLATPPKLQAEGPVIPGFQRFFAAEPSLPGGRILLSELGCVACHQANPPLLAARPKPGPILSGIGGRTSAEWLRAYLSNPQDVKPGATMPHLLAGVDPPRRDATVDVLVHFLMSNTTPLMKPLQEDKDASLDASSAQRGRDLFHSIGCVACHDPDAGESDFFAAQAQGVVAHGATDAGEAEEEADDGRVTGRRPRPRVGFSPSAPLPKLADKYDHGTLTQFLLDPLKVRPAGRMPDFQLDLLSAADIAHYLLKGRRPPPPVFRPDPGKVRQGEQVFTGLGCADCHELAGFASRRASPAPSLSDLANRAGGCLSPQPVGSLPFYHLNQVQIDSLKQAIQNPDPTPPLDRLHYQMAVANCYACHQRGDAANGPELGGLGERRWEYFRTASAVGEVDLGDEGRIPPVLTGVGRKLHPSWLVQVIQGKTRLRPHMTARMPGFPSFAPSIAADLAAIDQDDDAALSPPPPADTATIEAGRALLNLGCIQCHPLRGERLAGVVGVDLHRLAKRMQWPWFHDFLLNPDALKRGTRMPTFFRDGKSTAPAILEGDAELQIAALWAYVNSAAAPLPDRMEEQRTLDFELRPTTRPIVLRTFMKQAGQQAIAVGFPQGLHYAFDAERCRLAEIWKGRFLDAHSTWYDRFVPPTEPLGDNKINLVAGSAMLRYAANRSPASPKMRWLGYRVSETGTPTFLYQADDVRIEDTIEPTTDGALQRTMRCQGDTTGLWVRLAAGNRIARIAGGLQVDGLHLSIAQENNRTRRVDSEIRFPLPGEADRWTLKVEYRW